MDKESTSTQIGDDCVYSTTTDFTFFWEKRTILLHNGDGLQSLLSICNALILRHNMVLENQFSKECELLLFLRDKLEELCPETMKDSLPAAVSRTQELGEYHPKPVWDGIDSFKDNTCALIFEALEIPLFHGWIITDKNVEPKCYDEIDIPGSSDLEKTMLDKNGDVTDYGLSFLKERIQNHQVCVLVHNNGLHTAIKHEDDLYLLVLERSIHSSGRVWQKLNGRMVGEDFIEIREGFNSDEVEEGIGLDAMGEHFIYSTTTEFNFFGENRTILLHHGNRLQSLLSICNALILRHNAILEDQFIDEWELLWFLKEQLEKLCPETIRNSLPAAVSRTQELGEYHPKPVWDGIDSFKDNTCALIFEALQIPLFHGWIITDKNVEPKCYDEIDIPGSSDLEKTMLDKNGDVTDYGLSFLKERIQNHQVCVLVHNNGLHTAIKHEDDVYLLVVERSLHSSGRVWQKLNGCMVGEDFIEIREGFISEEEGCFSEDGYNVEDEGYSGDSMETQIFGSMEDTSSEEGIDVGVGDDSEDSMETHTGRISPTTVLGGHSSSFPSSD